MRKQITEVAKWNASNYISKVDNLSDKNVQSNLYSSNTDGSFTMANSNSFLSPFLSLGSDYFSATFYQTYFYYKPSKYSPFTDTHFCNLFTQSRKVDK